MTPEQLRAHVIGGFVAAQEAAGKPVQESKVESAPSGTPSLLEQVLQGKNQLAEEEASKKKALRESVKNPRLDLIRGLI